jgi:hypothetical protein
VAKVLGHTREMLLKARATLHWTKVMNGPCLIWSPEAKAKQFSWGAGEEVVIATCGRFATFLGTQPELVRYLGAH